MNGQSPDNLTIGYAPREIKAGEVLTVILTPEPYFITSDGMRSLTKDEAETLKANG